MIILKDTCELWNTYIPNKDTIQEENHKHVVQ